MQVFSEIESTSVMHEVTSYLLNDLWEELLIKNGACWAKVVSDSMSPTIRRGDSVLVEEVRPENIRFGDIIVFRRDGILTIHRLIGKHKTGGDCQFLEKGDANLQSGFVPAKDVIGRVTTIKTTVKTITTMSGSGRLMQLTLACISYTSLKLRAIIRHCVTRGGRISYRHHGGMLYNRFFTLLHKTVLKIIM